MTIIHQPVLLGPVLELLAPKAGETYLDLTAGYGGHAKAVQSRTGRGQLILVDQDQEAVAYLRSHFKGAQIMQSDFTSACRKLAKAGLQVDMILMDLGLSSAQIDNQLRGFSFRKAGPLDMRMDQSSELTAADIVNRFREQELADILYTLGEERRSRQIAKAIVRKRPVQNTAELAAIVASQYRGYSRIHPATRSFQALRIAVNDELNQLSLTLPLALQLLKPGGRLAVISFHSLEDRQVKQFLKSHQDELETLTKKVIKGADRDVNNPRARSAKLRAARKK